MKTNVVQLSCRHWALIQDRVEFKGHHGGRGIYHATSAHDGNPNHQ